MIDKILLSQLFEQVARGELNKEEAIDRCFAGDHQISESMKGEDFFIDLQRDQRCGFPEIVYGEGKSIDQLKRIIQSFLEYRRPLLITRVGDSVAKLLLEAYPELTYHPVARTIHYGQTSTNQARKVDGKVAIVSAGTSDLPVASEASQTLTFLRVDHEMVTDVGVAGIHRLFAHWNRLSKLDIFIVVAGMEGALPSVIGGLTNKPVIAVPTSIGYGTHWKGLAPLLTMLNSCASGVCVVNIDNGLGAACAAYRILSLLYNKCLA